MYIHVHVHMHIGRVANVCNHSIFGGVECVCSGCKTIDAGINTFSRITVVTTL